MKHVGSVTDKSYVTTQDIWGAYNFLNELRRCGKIEGYPNVVAYQNKRIYLDEYGIEVV